MNEIWKTINDFPNYEVSNLGRVRNKNTKKLLCARIGREGLYYSVYLINNSKENTQRVHRLVAKAFIPNPENKPMVNHIDGNKLNNNVNNLEWVTAKENNNHAVRTGLNHPGAYQKRPIKILETGEIFDGVVNCAKAVDGDFRNVYRSLNTKEKYAVNGLHFEYVDEKAYKKYEKKQISKKHPILYPHQEQAIKKMFNGCILNGGVGSGKSITGLYYYFDKYGGNFDSGYSPMKNPKDLYIITTAKKRNDFEWDNELSRFLLNRDPELNYYKNKVIVDSWQNIKKYSDVKDAFFIFDEDKVTGNGVWAKSFLKITKCNEWIILSATSGDRWEDYEAVFIANGFFKNRTEMRNNHYVYSRFTKFPKVSGYMNEGRLIRLRNKILIDMEFDRTTVPHHEDVYVKYDIKTYRDAIKKRWDIYKDEPIQQASGLCYVLRRIVNSDESRQVALLEIFENHRRMIVFYNFDYERDILLNLYYGEDITIAEYSGHAHQPIPDCNRWVYLVQYTAGCEGFNCTKTDCIVFYSQNYSYKVMIQAAGRIDRLNTPYKDLYYYHIKSRSGIDLAISKALKTKKKFNERKFTKWND